MKPKPTDADLLALVESHLDCDSKIYEIVSSIRAETLLNLLMSMDYLVYLLRMSTHHKAVETLHKIRNNFSRFANMKI